MSGYFKTSIEVVFEASSADAARRMAAGYVAFIMKHGADFDVEAPEHIGVGTAVVEQIPCSGCNRDFERVSDGAAPTPIRLNAEGLCAACVNAEGEAAADARAAALEPNCAICGFEKNAPHTGHRYKPAVAR